MKTREEIEQLKLSWMSDPCFDLAGGEGWEEHEAELAAFEKEQKARWLAERMERFIRSGGGQAITVYPSEEPGMTVRTWLIGQALAGLCANPDSGKASSIASEAVAVADAVMALLADEVE
jgi:hypothetical protein